ASAESARVKAEEARKKAEEIKQADAKAAAAREKARRAAEAEAAALREMLSRPRNKVQHAAPVKEPEKPAAAPGTISGTLHKSPAKAGVKAKPAEKPAAAPAAAPAPGVKKDDKPGTVKKGSPGKSGWNDESKGRKGLKTRGDTTAGSRDGWRGGRGGRGGRHGQDNRAQQPTELIVREVHVPETRSVSDVAPKMANNGHEVTKILMMMGQMEGNNQVLHQEPARNVWEEQGYTAIAATRYARDACLDEAPA